MRLTAARGWAFGVAATFAVIACAAQPATAFADMSVVPRASDLFTDPTVLGLITVSAVVVIAVAVFSFLGLRRLARSRKSQVGPTEPSSPSEIGDAETRDATGKVE